MVRMEQTQQEEEENNQCCFTEMGDLAAVFMGDAFRIEDLAEFSNEDIAGPISSNSLSSCLSGSSPQHSINGFSCPHFLPDDLAVICPSYTDTGLEWLTSFTEDSTAPSNATNDSGSSSVAEEAKQSSDTGQDEQQQKRKAREVPGRARSKRPRTSLAHSLVRSWSCTSLTRNDREEQDEPEAEEQETVTMEVEKKSSRTGQQPRRCTHCLSQRTPQWRAGPLGPKTLCNACGVRYKSGRLFPEYRPAKSPTFVRYIHSNSHKKVLEMRSQQDQSHSDFNHLNPNLSPTMIPIRQFPAQVSTNSSPLKLKFKLAAGSPV